MKEAASHGRLRSLQTIAGIAEDEDASGTAAEIKAGVKEAELEAAIVVVATTCC